VTRPTDWRTGFVLLVVLSALWLPRVVRAQATGEFLCSRGTRDGLPCESDDDCVPNGVCVIALGVCNGGTDDGASCDCPAGTCSAQPVCEFDDTFGTCSGGTSAGECCDVTFNCSDGSPCTGSAKLCLSGDFKGAPCLNNSQCVTGVCAATGKLCAGVCQGGTNANQFCFADEDCPGSTCASDFQSFSCVDDSDCCVDQPCPTGICQGVAATPTPTRGTPTPTRTRSVSPTRTPTGATPTPTPTPSGGVTATATPTPVPTATGSPIPTARLVSSVSATQSTISVDDATAFPGSGTLLIDTEQMSYTGKLGNTFTGVQRGVNGTTATTHATGSAVQLSSSSVPTPPKPTATAVPRDIIYQTIGEGSGCTLQAGQQRDGGAQRRGSRGAGQGTHTHLLILTAIGVAIWGSRQRRKD
jgi:hypothetical protein